jgi:hypothetical protein
MSNVPSGNYARPNEMQLYDLALDGPLLRRQRELLFMLMEAADECRAFDLGPAQLELLDGLVNLTNALADQAHDEFGIECLVDGDDTDDTDEFGSVGLRDGGSLEFAPSNGMLCRRSPSGEIEVERRPGDEGYDELLAAFQDKRALDAMNAGQKEGARAPTDQERLATAKLSVEVTFNPNVTDAESLAVAADRLMETILSTPDILDEYGSPHFGPFLVVEEEQQ